MKKLDGGLSRLTRDLLRTMFIEDKIATDGVSLILDRELPPMIVKIILCSILGDEDALNDMFFTLGASGICPCGVLCSVTNKPPPTDTDNNIPSMSELDPEIQDISCADLALCHELCDKDVWARCDQLEACIDKKVLEEKERCTGIKFNPSTLLFCKELRVFVGPSSTSTGDPMHIIFANGILSMEIMLCMASVREEVDAYFEDVRNFSDEKKYSPKTTCFSKYREEHSHATLKVQASELLSDYPLLRAYLVTVYGVNATEPHIVSILLLFEICDFIRLLLKHPPQCEVQEISHKLQGLCKKYIEAFVSAYGRDMVRFKHHQLLHFPKQLGKQGVMLSCWVTERKNKHAKSGMHHICDPMHIESAGLARLTNNQVCMLETPGWLTTLTASTTPFPELCASFPATRVDLSPSMRWNGMSLMNKDVTFLDLAQTYLVIVVACLRGDQSYAIIVKCCRRLTTSAIASTWEIDPDAKIYRLVNERLFKPAFYRYVDAAHIEVLY